MARLVPMLMNVTRAFLSNMIVMVRTKFAQTKITVWTVCCRLRERNTGDFNSECV